MRYWIKVPDLYGKRAVTGKSHIRLPLTRFFTQQQEDGGWSITWTPAGDAAIWEWRAYWTLTALTVLKAYDRISGELTGLKY
jgi:hypothetical protein